MGDREEIIANIKRAIAEKLADLPLQPGNYILTRDVTNPFPDKRKKYDWRDLPFWKAGSEFVVVEHHNDIEYDGEKIPAPYYSLDIRKRSSHRLDVRRPTKADDIDALKLQALAGSLQKVEPETIGKLFTGDNEIFNDHRSVYLLAVLLEEEKITLNDIRGAIKRIHEFTPTEYAEFKKRSGL